MHDIIVVCKVIMQTQTHDSFGGQFPLKYWKDRELSRKRKEYD